MKPFVNCYRVIELSEWELDTIRNLGFRGIRFDLKSHEDVSASCERLASHGLSGIMLINGDKMQMSLEQTVDLAAWAAGTAAGDIAIEIGNEPDISPTYEGDHDGFGRMVNAAAMAVKGRCTVISGGIFNTGRAGLEYLREALEWIDPTVHVGVHSYRQTTSPYEAKKPFKSRTDEWRAIREVARGRPVWCTETGWHTAQFPTGWFGLRKKHWTNNEVLAFLNMELQIQSQGGAKACVVYQWTDGPTEEGIDRFGLKFFGVPPILKPQAQCVNAPGTFLGRSDGL